MLYIRVRQINWLIVTYHTYKGISSKIHKVHGNIYLCAHANRASGYLNHKPVFSDSGQLLVAVEMPLMLSAADPPSTSEPLWTEKGDRTRLRDNK